MFGTQQAERIVFVMKRNQILFAAAVIATTTTINAKAMAAGGPYAVDDAEISPPGECKVESWASFGDNGDRAYVAVPSCTFAAIPRVEFGLQVDRSRDDRSWTTTLEPRLKAVLVPLDRYGIGIAIAGGVSYDTTADMADALSIALPATVEPVDGLRLNFNLGWERDRTIDRHFLTWGIGAEWLVWEDLSLIGEAFGKNEGRSGFQLGIRPTVFDGQLDIDLVLGRNITDARASWLTLGATVRF